MMMMMIMTCCGMAGKRMGKLGLHVRKMKALTVKKDTQILTDKGR